MTRQRARALVFAVITSYDRDTHHWKEAQRLSGMQLEPPKNLVERFVDLLERLEEPE